ncbi:MAG: hypothetical protein RL088_3123 [Verrucomicrobiota bacterium]|jgi:hypothetical protein
MKTGTTQLPESRRRGTILRSAFRASIVGLILVFGWVFWSTRQRELAINEARNLGWTVSYKTAFSIIKGDWRAAFRSSTWINDEPILTIDESSQFDKHADLVRRIAPRKLRIHDISDWTDLAHLRGFKSIRNLGLGSGRNITSLEGLESLPNLESFFAPGREKLRDISAIRELKRLRTLTLSLPNETTDLSIVAGLGKLKFFTVIHGRKLRDISVLSGHPTLTDLAIYDVERLPDLTPLTTIPNLSTLSLSNVGNADAITTFPMIPGLKTINLPHPEYFPKRLRDLIKTANPTATIFSD